LIARELGQIREALPGAISELDRLLGEVGLPGGIGGILGGGVGDVSALASRAGSYALSAGSGVFDLVLVLVGSIFIAANPELYRSGLLALLPRQAEPAMQATLDDCGTALRGWMLGQLLTSIFVGTAVAIVLGLMGVPAATGLGLIAGVLDIIPFFGPTLSAVPAVLLALTEGAELAVWTLLAFLVIQQIQGNVVQPLIQRRTAHVPPAVLIFGVAAAGILFGLLGVLLSAPLTITVYMAVRRIHVATFMGRPIDTDPPRPTVR
jgi:predicted PurR-regulated permease PerM